MMMNIILIALLCISQTYGFQMMKSLISRERKSISMTPLVDTVVISNVDLLNQGLLISDAVPVAAQGFAFLLIAAAIMGSLQNFLAEFDKK